MQDNFKRNRLLIVFRNPWHRLNLWSLTQTPRGRFIHCAAEITRGSWEKQKKKNPCWKSENDSSRPGDTYSWYVIRTFVLLVLCINWKTDDLPHYSLFFQLLNCQELSVFSLNTQTSFRVTTKTFLVHPISTLFLRRHDFGRKDCSYWTSQKNCEAHVTSQTGNGNIFKSVFSYIASCYI